MKKKEKKWSLRKLLFPVSGREKTDAEKEKPKEKTITFKLLCERACAIFQIKAAPESGKFYLVGVLTTLAMILCLFAGGFIAWLTVTKATTSTGTVVGFAFATITAITIPAVLFYRPLKKDGTTPDK